MPASQTLPEPARRHGLTLALLTLSYAVCHLDRNIVTILLGAIKAEFQVSDAALGLLTGLTFAAFYGGVGIPLAYVADRANRRHLLGASLTLFSALTFLSGLTSSFAQLVAARIGIGIGEGGAVPTAQSIIADSYPPERRTFALGIYSTGLSIGTLLGLGMGGLVSKFYGWRAAFLVAGVISIAISLLCWILVPEPSRSGESRVSADRDDTPGMWATFRHLWSDQPAYRHLVAAATVAAIPGFALLVWTPTLLGRAFGMPLDAVGLWSGLLFGAGGAAGILLSSFAADRLARREPRLALLPPMIGCCLVGCFAIAFALSSSPGLALAMLVIPAAGYTCYTGPLYGVIHTLVEPRMRARAIAILLLITNLGGLGLGPALAGYLSDRFAATAGAMSLNYALLGMQLGWFWAVAHFWLASRHMERPLPPGSSS